VPQLAAQRPILAPHHDHRPRPVTLICTHRCAAATVTAQRPVCRRAGSVKLTV
jgi:hypothetical protein